MFKIFDFRIMPDFAQGQTVLFDGYLEGRFSPAFKVRAGKFKPPVGLERLQSATDIFFVERAYPTSLVPSRDVGIQVSGDVGKSGLNYAVGYFNGVPDGGSTGDVDDKAFPLFANPASAASVADSVGLGLNWYLNRNLKVMLDYERTEFEGGAASATARTRTSSSAASRSLSRRELK